MNSAPLLSRDELLWWDEFAEIREQRAQMAPTVRDAVDSVLESLLREGLEPSVEDAVRSLRVEIRVSAADYRERKAAGDCRPLRRWQAARLALVPQ